MGNNCCDKANTNAKNIEALQASASSGSDSDVQTQIASLQSDVNKQIGALKQQIKDTQGPTLQAIESVIQNNQGQIAQAITSTLGKSFVTKGLLGLDNSQSTLTFDGNMVLKCSSGSGQDCLTVQGSGALASARQWKAGGATPSPSASAWSLGSDGNLAANTIAASGDIVGQSHLRVSGDIDAMKNINMQASNARFNYGGGQFIEAGGFVGANSIQTATMTVSGGLTAGSLTTSGTTTLGDVTAGKVTMKGGAEITGGNLQVGGGSWTLGGDITNVNTLELVQSNSASCGMAPLKMPNVTYPNALISSDGGKYKNNGEHKC